MIQFSCSATFRVPLASLVLQCSTLLLPPSLLCLSGLTAYGSPFSSLFLSRCTQAAGRSAEEFEQAEELGPGGLCCQVSRSLVPLESRPPPFCVNDVAESSVG